jgi:Ca2+-binding EF-hand superfamily protein
MMEEAFERAAAKGLEAIISAYDKNGDGKVSLEESGVRKQLFMRYDKNSDGVIDASDK